MTTELREPDRFEAKARARIAYDAMQSVCTLSAKCAILETAIKEAEASALERAAQICENLARSRDETAAAIRALASPAAAPAADGPKVTERLLRDAAWMEKLTHPAPPEPDTGPDYDGDAPPSEPAAPERHHGICAADFGAPCMCKGKEPAPLLSRVLAALTGAAIDAASHGHIKAARDRNDLAAELRAYIAERERDDTNVPDDIDPRNFEKYDAEAQKRIAELERRVEAGLRYAKHRYPHWARSGGEPECLHGINLGIECSRCDLITLETGAARAATAKGTK